MELLRLGLIYIHLIACCIALGLIIKHDWAMFRRLLRGADTVYRTADMREAKTVVGAALLALWLSGTAVICLDIATDGIAYLTNPKLQAKIIVVAVLSLNGCVLHRLVLPAWEAAGSLMNLAPQSHALAIFSGAVSAVSWLYAALLGVGEQLSWKYTLLQLLAAYPLLIAGATVTLLMLTRHASPNDTPSPHTLGRARRSL